MMKTELTFPSSLIQNVLGVEDFHWKGPCTVINLESQDISISTSATHHCLPGIVKMWELKK